MSRIDVAGVDWNIEDSGAGFPLLLLHGFTGSGRTWRPFAGRWPGMRTIAVDLIGHGGSDSPAEEAPYRIEATTAALATILDRLGIGRAAVLGYSLGGRVALHFAVAYPERLKALILESATPGIADDAERQKRREDDDRLAARIETEGLEAFVDYWQDLPLWKSQVRLSPERRLLLREQRLQNNAGGLANSLRGAGTGACPPLHERLAAISVPALVMAGRLDTRYVALAEFLAEKIPQATVSIIDNAGHAAHFEGPDAFAGVVGEFLARCVSLSPLEARA